MKRRTFLKSTAGLAAAALTGAGRQLVAAEDALPPARIGVIGVGNRGTYLMRLLLKMPGVAVTAVCDTNEANLKRAIDVVSEAKQPAPAGFGNGPQDYRRMLERTDVDGVLIATPTKWHCPMAVDAMNAGKHVGSDVPAGFELDELWDLVRTKEKTGRRYMLLENYLYSRRSLMLWNMARAGLFGDSYYAECSYIHDCRFMLFRQDGSLDWWGDWVTKHYGNDYPTHALGPISKWMGINEGDRLERCSSLMSAPRVLKLYAEQRFGKESPQAKLPWVQGEFIATLIHTAQGRLIRVDYDPTSPRPASIYYLIQGTKGVYDSRTGVYFDGNPEEWKDADTYLEKYDHAYWKRDEKAATESGHGGGDWFVVRDFVDMVRRDREPWIDVYDAATWSVLFHCSRLSIDRKGDSVEIPDFTGGRWKRADWRKDHAIPA